MWWVLGRCSIGDVRRRGMRKMLWWWRLVMLRVVTVLGMAWRCGRDGCRGMRRRMMLVVHRRQGRRRMLRDVALRRIRHSRRVLCWHSRALTALLLIAMWLFRRVDRDCWGLYGVLVAMRRRRLITFLRRVVSGVLKSRRRRWWKRLM